MKPSILPWHAIWDIKKKKLPTKFNTESDAVDATMMLSKADTLLENEKAVTIAVA